jgi:hypothetical protein
LWQELAAVFPWSSTLSETLNVARKVDGVAVDCTGRTV